MRKELMSALLGAALSNQVPVPQYFPPGSLNDSARLSKLREDWYSTQLQGFGEPSFVEQSKDKAAESYRFLWLRSFNDAVCIRMDILADGSGVVTKKVSGVAHGKNAGKMIVNEQVRLIKEDVTKFLAQMGKQEFWSLPTRDNRRGLDGSEWVIEGVKAGNYHVVDRWSPDKGPVRSMGTSMLELAKLKFPTREMY
jgi:hypothetical protein